MSKPLDPIAVAFEVFNEIGIIAQLGHTEFARALPDDLSTAGFAALNRFVRMGLDGDSPARMARAFQVTKGAMTYTLQRLEANGHVTLDPDPQDGRGKIVRITEKGRIARDEAIARLAPMLGDLLQTMDFAELAAILPTLKKLRQTLDAARD